MIVTAGVVLLVLAVVVLSVTNIIMVRHYAPVVSGNAQALPRVSTALVLGTSHYSLDGKPSVHFAGRMDAAHRLYAAGRVERLLLSGANPSIHYNEPQRMREALLERGIPDDALVLDYAGRRTLDSVRRARDVFGQRELIIVSQPYHLYRALFLADHDGIRAYGLAATGPGLRQRWRTEWREVLARMLAVLDVYLLETEPRFPARPEEICDDCDAR